MARKRGLSVVTFSDGDPLAGSINAAGIVKKSWYKGEFFKKKVQPEWWTTKWLDFGVDWLGEHAGLVQTGEDVKKLYGKDRLTRTNNDCWVLVDVMEWLKDEDSINYQVTRLSTPTGAWRLHDLADYPCWLARKVIVAAGHATDRLLAASNLPLVGVSGLEGRAVFVKGRLLSGRPFRVLRSAYDHVTFREWPGGLVRVGDTVGAKDLPLWWKDNYTSEMWRAANHDAWGFRPVCERAFVELVAPDLVVATGGHRVGMAMSPAVAHRALKLLGLL
jgi:hypothetical protein